MKRARTEISESITIFNWLFKLCFTVEPILSSLFIFLAVVQISMGIIGYYATAHLTAGIIYALAKSTPYSYLWNWLFVVVGSSFLANTGFRVNHMLERKIYFSLTRWTAMTYARQLSTIDLKDFYDSETRSRINRLNQGFTWQLPNAAYFTLSIVQSFLNLLAIILTIGLVVWWLVPIFALLLIPMFIYEGRVQKIGWFVFSHEGDNQHVFWGMMDNFQDVKKQFEVRALGASKRLFKLLGSLNDRFYDLQIKEVNKTNKLGFVAIVSQVVREAVAQAWLLHKVLTRTLSIESYLFYVSMVFRLDGAISGTFMSLAQLQSGIKFSADFHAFLQLKPTIVDAPDAKKIQNGSPQIEFVNAAFKYPNSDRYVFENLSFTIDAGTKVALIGENGAGKSTIIKLLLRYYQLEKGQILVNGIDINDIAIDSLLSQMAVLFQDYNRYTLTVAENIAISKPSVNQSDVVKAAKLSGADSFISELPLGYKTYLNPSMTKGVELSGGQWQRIALARAFYRGAHMIVLDEPTSAIDAKAEYQIFTNIFTHYAGKTALIVSHRFSTVRKADRIIVLDKGKIVEDGSHDELIQKDGLYTELFNRQAEGYR